MCSSANTSHFLLAALVTDAVPARKPQPGWKETHSCLQCPLALPTGRWVCAMLYYIQRTLCFVLFVFVHAPCNYHNDIPKQAHEGEQTLRRDRTGAGQAMDAFESKTSTSPGNSSVGLGHGWMQMEKGDSFLNGATCSSCLHGGGRGKGGRAPGALAGLEPQNEGLANHNPELTGEERKDFACSRGSRRVIPVPVEQECQAVYLKRQAESAPRTCPGSIPAPGLLGGTSPLLLFQS